jgi:hypothetical protein
LAAATPVFQLAVVYLWRFSINWLRSRPRYGRTHTPITKGDQYTFVALASSAKAILSYRTGKRDSENTDLFVQDLRERVLGAHVPPTGRSGPKKAPPGRG